MKTQPEFHLMSVRELMQKAATRKPLIKTGKAGIDLKPACGWTYLIVWDRCDTTAKILEWVLHLSEKNWITPQVLREFIKAACDRHGINPWVNA